MYEVQHILFGSQRHRHSSLIAPYNKDSGLEHLSIIYAYYRYIEYYYYVAQL